MGRVSKIRQRFGSTSLLLVFLFTVVSAPASAYHLSSFSDPEPGEIVDTRNRILASLTRNIDNGAAGNILNFTFPWDPEYSFQDKSHTIRIHISYTVTLSATSDGSWNITVAKESTGFLSNCSVRVETVNPVGITLDALLVYAHFNWDCLFTQSNLPHFHYHTVYVNRTVLSGSPNAPTAETVAVRLETEDVVVTSMASDFEILTGLTGIEFLALISVVIVAIVVWSRTTDFLVQMTMGIICFIPAVIFMLLTASGGWIGNVALAVICGAIGGYLILRASVDKATGGDTT